MSHMEGKEYVETVNPLLQPDQVKSNSNDIELSPLTINPAQFYTHDDEDSDDDSDTDEVLKHEAFRHSLVGEKIDSEYLVAKKENAKIAKARRASAGTPSHGFRDQHMLRCHATSYSKHTDAVTCFAFYEALEVDANTTTSEFPTSAFVSSHSLLKSNLLISGDACGRILVWDLRTSLLVAKFHTEGKERGLTALVVHDPQRVDCSAGGGSLQVGYKGVVLVLSTGYSMQITVWNLATGIALMEFSDKVHTWFVSSLQLLYIPYGVFDNADSDVDFTEESVATLGGAAATRRSMENRVVVLSSSYDSICMWDLNTGCHMVTVNTNTLATTKRSGGGAVAISAINMAHQMYRVEQEKAGSFLLAGTYDKRFMSIDLSKKHGVSLFQLPDSEPSVVNCIATMPSRIENGEETVLAITGHSNGSACVWSVLDRQLLIVLDDQHTKTITSVDFTVSPFRGQLQRTTAVQRRSKHDFAVVAGEDVEKRRVSPKEISRNSRSGPSIIAEDGVYQYRSFNPNTFQHLHGLLAVTGGADGQVCIWEVSSGEVVRKCQRTDLSPVTGVRAISLAFLNKIIAPNSPTTSASSFGCNLYDPSLNIFCANRSGSVAQYDLCCPDTITVESSHDLGWIHVGTLPMKSKTTSISEYDELDYIVCNSNGAISYWNLETQRLKGSFVFDSSESINMCAICHYSPTEEEWREIIGSDVTIKEDMGLLVAVPSVSHVPVKLFCLFNSECVAEFPASEDTRTDAVLLLPPSKLPKVSEMQAADVCDTCSKECGGGWLLGTRPKVLVVYGSSATILIHDLLTGKCIKRITKDDLMVSSIMKVSVVGDHDSTLGVYSPKLLFTSHFGLYEFDLATCTLIRQFQSSHSDSIRCCYIYNPVSGMDYGHSSLNQRLVVTGGLDKTACVSMYSSGKVLRTIGAPHGAAVLNVSVYDPCATARDDTYKANGVVLVVLITASTDNTVVMSCLASGVLLRVLDNLHSGSSLRVMHLYSSTRLNKGPFVVTASDKGTVLMSDIEYPCGATLSSSSLVFQAFDSDLEHEKKAKQNAISHWPRVSKLYHKFGAILFFENPDLFAKAVFCKRDDFLQRFQQPLSVVIHKIGEISPGMSCVDYAMHKKDLKSLRVLLNAWSKALNRDVNSLRGHVLTHPSNFLPLQTLLTMARGFPAEFCDFIKSIKLVKAAPEVAGICTQASVNEDTGFCVVKCDHDDCFNLWGQLFGSGDASHSQSVTALYLPIKYAAAVPMLQAYVNCAATLRDTSILNSEVVVIVLRQFWDYFGRKTNAALTWKYAIFLVVYMLYVYLYTYFNRNGLKELSIFGGLFFMGVVVYQLLFLTRRVQRRVAHEAYDTMVPITFKFVFTALKKLFLGSLWHTHDWLTLFFMWRGAWIRFTEGYETKESRCWLAVSSFFVIFKSLYYLRPLPSSGPLVAMIVKISWSIRFFVLIMVLVLTGVSTSFWLMYTPDGSLHNVIAVWYSSYLATLGSYSTDFRYTASPTLTAILFGVFLLFVSVLMLNLLIALMGDVYSQVAETGLGEWRMNQAEIILDMFYDDKNVEQAKKYEENEMPFVHVLKYSSQIEDQGEDHRKDNTTVEHPTCSADALRDELMTMTMVRKELNLMQSDSETISNARVEIIEQKLEALSSKLDILTELLMANQK